MTHTHPAPGADADPRARAFDYVITELWHWVNNDYAARGEPDRAKCHVIEATWMEIAQRIEAWRDETDWQPPKEAHDGQ